MGDGDVYLLYGKNGWIGGKLIELLKEQGKTFHLGDARTQNRESLEAELEKYKPTHVLNAAGVTGRPNVDWCEDHKMETVRTNVIGCLNMADLCATKNIHHTLFATGCIFEYDDAHTVGGQGFTEEDTPNFHGSYYSHTKAMVEDMLKIYPTTCTLRVRMPISDDLSPRNFITKIAKYDRVVNIPNSMTVLTEMLPASLVMAEKRLTGVYNFCNPGAISHNECLALYTKHVDPAYTWENFTVEEQDKILKAARSNNTLTHDKLMDAIPDGMVNEIHVAMEECMKRMKVNLEKEGLWPDNLPTRRG
jgi:dTDP-4-dehydrorhamnose reductase